MKRSQRRWFAGALGLATAVLSGGCRRPVDRAGSAARADAAAAVAPARFEDGRYGPQKETTWHRNTLEWDTWPIDVSFLSDGDRPAGGHGRVVARGADLAYEDGTPARFWGTNVQGHALFHGTKLAIANQAKRIAALGYNLVRICHHDSDWTSPNVFAPGDTTQKLDPVALDSIDWWVKCLRDEGIYVWLDLKMERVFRKGDGIAGFDEIQRSEPWARGFDYVDPHIEDLEQRFVEQYLARVNRYTGRSYIDDPAVLGVLITNENDLTTHFGNLMLPKAGNPVHTRMFEALVKESAAAMKLSVRDSLRTWEPGPAKIVLADLEARFFQRAFAHLRRLGYAGLVAGTNYWGDEEFMSLASLAVGDVIDAHTYGKAESLGQDPRAVPNLISYVAAASVGKPVVVTEWNIEYPTPDRFVGPLYVASIASLQGWDALMQYGYWQPKIEAPRRPHTWSSAYDPGLTALMPAAAIMFRQRHVGEALKTYRLSLDRRQLYYDATSPRSSAALRTLAEQSKIVLALPDLPELAWDGGGHTRTSAGAKAPVEIRDPGSDFLSRDKTFVVSDTGELKRDWALGVQTIDTPRSQAAAGWIGGRAIQLRDVRFQIRTPKATAVVTSLDGEPIAHSRRMLLTVVAQVAASPGGTMPLLAQPVEGSLTLRTDKPLRVTPLSPRALPGATEKLEPFFAPSRRGQATFEIPREISTHWFLLTP